MKLSAPCKDYVWGGTRLKTEYGKVSDMARIAESWELSCHPDGLSVIANGEYAGRTLAECLGNTDNFPIIVKLIDAADNLSVQVHPNKAESWYILDAAPDSELILGFTRELTRGEFRERIENGTLFDVLNRVKVKKGDVFFIPSGTVHAIGKGVLIAEVQQNSNITYRVYDYGRGRELHVNEAVETARLIPYTGGEVCEYYKAEERAVAGEVKFCADEQSFNAILVTEGEVSVDGVTLEKGASCFIHANYGEYTVSGEARILYIKV